jgi:hypothetical protein
MRNRIESKLETKFELIFHQLSIIEQLSNDLEYYYQEEFLKLFDNNQYYRMTFSTKALFTLRLTNLLNRKEDLNLFYIIDNLQIHIKNSSWEKFTSIEELKNIENKLNVHLESNALKTLKRFRNKLYAHLDKNFSNSNLSSDLIEVKLELKGIISIFKRLSDIFGLSYIFSANSFNQHNLIADSMRVFYELDNRIRNGEKDNIDSMSLKELYKILYS